MYGGTRILEGCLKRQYIFKHIIINATYNIPNLKTSNLPRRIGYDVCYFYCTINLVHGYAGI